MVLLALSKDEETFIKNFSTSKTIEPKLFKKVDNIIFLAYKHTTPNKSIYELVIQDENDTNTFMWILGEMPDE